MYQTFKELGLFGDSNSQAKLERLQLPADLSGKRILDLGCNSGFFCFACANYGAAEVTGIDIIPEFIIKAEEIKKLLLQKNLNVGNVKFEVQDWNKISGKFDIVLWLSAFHYAREKQDWMIANIVNNLLDNDGVLILECGVSDKNSDNLFIEKYARSQEEIGREPFYPNIRMMHFYLHRFDYQLKGPSVEQAGDKIQRYVFYVKKKSMPNLMIITGQSGVGKTFLLEKLKKAGPEIIGVSWDEYFLHWLNSRQALPKIKKYFGIYDVIQYHLGEIWGDLKWDNEIFTLFYNDFIESMSVLKGDVIVEGYGIKDFLPKMKEMLAGKFIIRTIEITMEAQF